MIKGTDVVRFAGVVAAGVWMSSCASTVSVDDGSDSGSVPVMVRVGDFAETFQAAKDVLREYRFELDRVDAREGVITTRAMSASGWATPWVDHASDWDGAWRDTLQDEARKVRVVFGSDVEGGDRNGVGVVVERIRVTRFGRRVDPTSPRRIKRMTRDPMRAGVDVETVGRDSALEARILGDILDRVGGTADADLAVGSAADPR